MTVPAARTSGTGAPLGDVFQPRVWSVPAHSSSGIALEPAFRQSAQTNDATAHWPCWRERSPDECCGWSSVSRRLQFNFMLLGNNVGELSGLGRTCEMCCQSWLDVDRW